MTIENLTSPISPVLDENGKAMPGLFAFDNIERDMKCNAEIWAIIQGICKIFETNNDEKPDTSTNH